MASILRDEGDNVCKKTHTEITPENKTSMISV